MPSFTTQVPNLQSAGAIVEARIAVNGHVEEILRKSGAAVPMPITLTAMIDTGATGSVIREGLPAQLGLNPVGVTQINTPSSTNVQCFEFLLRVVFPNNVIFETTVIEAPLQGQHIQFLIGRDILQHCVMICVGYLNQFTLSV